MKKKRVSPIHSHTIHKLIDATWCFLGFIQAIVKTLSLTENLDLALASGPIEVRHFFKMQAPIRPNPIRPGKPEPDFLFFNI